MPSQPRSLHVALGLACAVALAHACAGSDGAVHSPLGTGGPPPSNGSGDGATDDAGNDGGSDSGSDAGTDAGVDGGADAGVDAGCAGALGLPVSVAVDRCSTIPQQQSAVLIDSACDATLYLSESPRCSGRISGSLDSFAGACGTTSLNCTSPSLPGRITCRVAADAGCFIDVCASASDPACQ